jgi:hypothetical protein
MNADSAFQIGASHQVCQDYSLAGSSSKSPDSSKDASQKTSYVILCDGCSSSPDTDIGARLLAKAAERILLDGSGRTPAGMPEEVHEEAARRALLHAKLLGLRPEAVDATLLTAHVEGDELVLGCSGDGVLCLQSISGAIDVYSISYTSGYPIYPSYLLQPERLLALEESALASKEVKHFQSPSLSEPLRLRDTSSGGPRIEKIILKARDYKYVALFSDGIKSFYSTKQTESGKGVEAIPMSDILLKLICFKSERGAFVARRMQSFMKDCRIKGWRHWDDLAVAAINLRD